MTDERRYTMFEVTAAMGKALATLPGRNILEIERQLHDLLNRTTDYMKLMVDPGTHVSGDEPMFRTGAGYLEERERYRMDRADAVALATGTASDGKMADFIKANRATAFRILLDIYAHGIGFFRTLPDGTLERVDPATVRIVTDEEREDAAEEGTIEQDGEP